MVVLAFIALLGYAYWESTANERAARRLDEERKGIGMQATTAGLMLANAAKSCGQIGIQKLPVCAANNGTLIYDITAQAMAEMALKHTKEFQQACVKHYDGTYCDDLLNRAFQIAYSDKN